MTDLVGAAAIRMCRFTMERMPKGVRDMFAVISHLAEGLVNPQSLIDFGRREVRDGDAYYRGQIGEMTVLFIPQTGDDPDFETAAERILTRHPVLVAAYVGPATPFVPYLQHGDLVVADRILPWPDNDTPGSLGLVLPETAPDCVIGETELVGGTFAAYELLYTTRSDRPQMIIGSVLSGRYPAVEKHMQADLRRQYGVVVGDNACLPLARVTNTLGIRFLYLGIVADNPNALTPSVAEPAMAVLRRFFQTRPVAMVASVGSV